MATKKRVERKNQKTDNRQVQQAHRKQAQSKKSNTQKSVKPAKVSTKVSTSTRSASKKLSKKTQPAKKGTKQKSRSQPRQTYSRIDFSQSYVSLLLGIIVVAICVLMFFIFFNVKNVVAPAMVPHKAAPSILNGISHKNLKTPQATNPTDKITGASYTVQEGDDLFGIAQRAYGDGDRWVDIANVNNIAEPDILNAGQVIKIPR